MKSETEEINLSYIFKITAIVPPLTPGITFAKPIIPPKITFFKKIKLTLSNILNVKLSRLFPILYNVLGYGVNNK